MIDNWLGLLLFAVGVLAGIVLIAMLPGMPWSATQLILDLPIPTDQHDLEAQRGMMAAAWYMVLLTAISIVIGIGGLVALVLTLRETRRIGEAQTRAYLVVMEASVERGQQGDWVVRFAFNNSGQTPSVSLMTEIEVWYEIGMENAWVDSGIPRLRELRSRSDIASHDTKHAVYSFDIEDGRSQLGLDKFMRLRTRITLRYKDVFGEGNEVEARYHLMISAFTEPPEEGGTPLMRSIT